MFNDMRIGSKLAIGFGIVLVLVIGAGLYGVFSYLGTVNNYSAFAERRIGQTALVRWVGEEVKTQVQDWKNILLRGHDPVEFAKNKALFDDETVQITKMLDDLKTGPYKFVTDENLKNLDELTAEYNDLLKKYDAALKIFIAGKADQRGADAYVKGADLPLDALVDKMTEASEKYTDQQTALIKAQTSFTGMVIIIFLLLSSIIGIVIAVSITRNISDPLRSLSDVARTIAIGDLSREVNVSSKDEIGMLGINFNDMVKNLRGLIAGIMKGGTEVTTSSNEMQATIQEQVSGATEQSSAVAETSSAITELSQTAGNITKITQDVQRISESTMNSIVDTNAKVNDTAQKILALGEKSQNISEIVKIIDDLSSQVNLLALNAKIEAARAGEAGKGFAVVATEISKLSDRSTESTEQIRKLISEIQAETSSAVMGVEESVKRGAKGVEMIAQTVQKVKEIAMATQQQQTASDQVMIAIKNIDTVAKNFVQSISQTSLAVEKLNKLAANLKKEVEQFKL